MRKILFVLLVVSLLPLSAFARKTTYVVTNYRFNYVKIKEVKAKEAAQLMMNHPRDISEEQMRAILASVKLSKGQIFSKEVDTQEVFSERAINFLAPALVRAFREATPNEKIVVSYLLKEPYFIIRNDRLTIADMWIHEDALHIRFQKLYAKLLGDTDKRGDHSKQIAAARGLRVDMDLQPGQMMSVNSEELLIDLNHDFVADLTAPKDTPVLPTETKSSKKKETSVAKAAEDPVVAATAPEAIEPEPADVQGRMEELEKLRKAGLITHKEYKQKRKEILKDL